MTGVFFLANEHDSMLFADPAIAFNCFSFQPPPLTNKLSLSRTV